MDVSRPWYPRVLVGAVGTVVMVGYGVLLYSFSVLVTGQAAGADFTTTVLSTAYGGAVLTGAATAVPVGRLADRHGVRIIMALGSLLTCAGMLGFAAAGQPWQVLATWWVLLGPASAMVLYEPAFVVVNQWFGREARNHAVATLTLLGGLAGPIFIPLASWLVGAFGWRPTAAMLGVLMAVVGGTVAVGFIRPAPGLRSHAAHGRRRRPSVGALARSPRFVVFTIASLLALGAFEALIVHRVARFTEAGFALATVSLWAAIASVVSLPGRYILPALANRIRATVVYGGVLIAMGAATAFAIRGSSWLELVGHFVLFGLVLGAAIPMRAVVMSDWYAGPSFGGIMGIQAAAIGLARAGGPPLVGALHDASGGYAFAFAAVTAAAALAGLLVIVSNRLADPLSATVTAPPEPTHRATAAAG